MDERISRRLRRAAKGYDEAADDPSDLRRALADLGRVINQPVAGEGARRPAVDAGP